MKHSRRGKVPAVAESLKFVPPKEETQKLPKYGSYVVGDGMKLHYGIGFAKNSLNNRMWHREIDPDQPKVERYGRTVDNYRAVTVHAFLLESVNGEWFTLYEIKPGLTKNQLPWMKEFFYNGWRWELVSEAEKIPYYNEKYLGNPDTQRKFKPVPMSTEEYVQFRLAIQREQLGLDK
jgi:hypothetical protein